MHARLTGQIDLGVDTDAEAWEAVRRWLSYLPSNAWSPAPRAPEPQVISDDPALAGWYDGVAGGADRPDVAGLLVRVMDPGSVFELRPGMGRSLVTAFARIDGWPVGVIASDPAADDGRIDAAGCEKAARLLMLCDSFDLPVITFIDSPGFAPSRGDDERLLFRWTRLSQAIALAGCPKLAVVVGRAQGPAFASLQHSGWADAGAYAWPGARMGVDAEPVGGGSTTGSTTGTGSQAIEESAGVLGVDEIIDPASTRAVLADDLARLAHREVRPPAARLLSHWSSC